MKVKEIINFSFTAYYEMVIYYIWLLHYYIWLYITFGGYYILWYTNFILISIARSQYNYLVSSITEKFKLIKMTYVY